MLRIINFIKLCVIQAISVIEIITHCLTLVLVFGVLIYMGTFPGLYYFAVMAGYMFFRYGHLVFQAIHDAMNRTAFVTAANFDKWMNSLEIYMENRKFMKEHTEGFAVIVRI